MVGFIGVFLGFVLLFVVMWAVVRLDRFLGRCRNCGARIRTWSRLDEEEQQAILRYCREVEGRDPRTSNIEVCENCQRVWDEFTGREDDTRIGTLWHYCKVCGGSSVYSMHETFLRHGKHAQAQLHPDFVETYECLRCERNPQDTADCDRCDTARKLSACARCMTLYEIQSPEWTDLRFLVPLTEVPLRERS